MYDQVDIFIGFVQYARVLKCPRMTRFLIWSLMDDDTPFACNPFLFIPKCSLQRTMKGVDIYGINNTITSKIELEDLFLNID